MSFFLPESLAPAGNSVSLNFSWLDSFLADGLSITGSLRRSLREYAVADSIFDTRGQSVTGYLPLSKPRSTFTAK